jgi:hypothetical protein
MLFAGLLRAVLRLCSAAGKDYRECNQESKRQFNHRKSPGPKGLPVSYATAMPNLRVFATG